MTGAAAVGLLAAFCTTIAFVPQVVKIWRTRSTRDISLQMFSVFTCGVILWLVYGVMLGSLPLILSNSITLVLALMIMALKLRYG